MRYKLLGRSGLRVSDLCLGAMTFGDEWGWGASKEESRRMFEVFAEAGGNFIDTANYYTNGTSERFVGEFVASERERFVIATKYTLNMRPDDAFWGARLVSRFSDDIIAAIVGAVGYDDPRAAAYLTRTIAERRDAVLRTWLTAVNPIVDVKLAPDGTLTFSNAAVSARATTAPQAYVVSWSRFDNGTGVHTTVGESQRSPEPRAAAPSTLLRDAEFIGASIRTEHPDYQGWQKPVQVYFKRTGKNWKTVGLFR